MIKLFSILGTLRTSQFGSDTLVAIGGDPVSACASMEGQIALPVTRQKRKTL